MIPTHTEPAREGQSPHQPNGRQVHTTETPPAPWPMDSNVGTQQRIDNMLTGQDDTTTEEKEKEPVDKPRKGDHIRYGKGRDDVREAIRESAPHDEWFNHHDVWAWFDELTKAEWLTAYKSRRAALSRVASTLNSIFKKVPNRQFDLVKIEHKTATYTFRPKGWVGEKIKEMIEELPPLPPPVSPTQPWPQPSKPMDPPSTPIKEVTFTLFGYTTLGVPLYIDNTTGAVGYVDFISISEV